MQWLIDNKEWIFSGVGVVILSFIIRFFIKQQNDVKQSQKSGKNSTNYQAGGNMSIGKKDDK